MKLAAQLHPRIKALQFERWWPLVSHKVAKADALKAFCQVVETQDDVDKLLANHPHWEREWASWRGRCQPPYPATYLRRRQWEDPPPWAQQQERQGPSEDEMREAMRLNELEAKRWGEL